MKPKSKMKDKPQAEINTVLYAVAPQSKLSTDAIALEGAAAKASSCNGFVCARYFVRPLQVLVRVCTTRELAWPGVRWHVKLRQEGPYPWASGAIAYNVPQVYLVQDYADKLT